MRAGGRALVEQGSLIEERVRALRAERIEVAVRRAQCVRTGDTLYCHNSTVPSTLHYTTLRFGRREMAQRFRQSGSRFPSGARNLFGRRQTILSQLYCTVYTTLQHTTLWAAGNGSALRAELIYVAVRRARKNRRRPPNCFAQNATNSPPA